MRMLQIANTCAWGNAQKGCIVAVVLVMAFFFASCGSNKEDASTSSADSTAVAEGELTEKKVEGWYKLFIDGKYDEYVKLIEAVDGKPEGYAEQMALLMKMRHRQQEDLHNGPKACRVERLDMKNDNFCEAYIELTFNDGAKEQFLLPLVKVNGRWRIR